MSGRGLAAAVIPCICGDGHDPPPHSRLCLENRIAALEKQTEDAQAARDDAISMLADGSRLYNEMISAQARAVCAEEALRQIAAAPRGHALHGRCVSDGVIEIAREALAAAGADTHGYIEVEEGRP